MAVSKNALLAVLAIGFLGLQSAELHAQTTANPQPFGQWLDGVREDARARGITLSTLDRALAGLNPIERVLELDRRQPEFTRTFWGYLDSFVTEERIQRGQRLMAQHQALLARVRDQYGVQARFLVAFWGMETNYGDYTGGFPVIGATATLAHDLRRSDFFRNELMNALQIVDEGHIAPEDMSGSWAGAMGQPQFMPSTFTGYAVDGDGDGRKDIWGTLPDVFASAANYLSSIGWNDDETWGREVRLPADFDLDLIDLSIRKHISEWQALGVRRADGSNLPAADIEGALVLPSGYQGPAFLVYGNYDAILTWNRSTYYALAVGYLSDRLVGRGRLVAERPEDDQPLHRDDILDLQRLLNENGYDSGMPDGLIGTMTRNAVRDYQRAVGLPPDGYPTHGLLTRLRGG